MGPHHSSLQDFQENQSDLKYKKFPPEVFSNLKTSLSNGKSFTWTTLNELYCLYYQCKAG